MAAEKNLDEVQSRMQPFLFPEIKGHVFQRFGHLTSYYSNRKTPTEAEVKKAGFHKIVVSTKEEMSSEIYFRKGDPRAPTVLILNGVGAEVLTGSYYHTALHLATHTRWNIGIVENAVNGKWMKRNQRIIFSGYETGWHLYQLIESFRNQEEYKDYMGSVHLVGHSLGGNDAAFAVYFDTLLQTKWIQSVFNVSSPSDRWVGFKQLSPKTHFDRWVVLYLIRSFITDAADLFKKYTIEPIQALFTKENSVQALTQIYLKSSIEYFEAHPHHFTRDNQGRVKAPLSLDTMKTEGILGYYQLLSLDACWEKLAPLSLSQRTPIFWLHGKNDPVVLASHNDDFFSRREIKAMGMTYKLLPYGGHLGFSTAYGKTWQYNMIKTYIEYWHEENVSEVGSEWES